MGLIRNIPIFTFYYILPISLGFITGLVIKDSQILSNRRKISMSVFSYYNHIDEKIPDHFLRILPDLDHLRNTFKNKKEEELNPEKNS